MSQRVAWAHLEHPKLGKIGLLAVYAPNGVNERKQLWTKIVDQLDKHREWIIGGDFNMVGASSDRKGASSKILQGVEKGAWTRLKRKLWLEDPFAYTPSTLRYSWDSKRKHRHNPSIQNGMLIGKRVLKLIDRIHSTATPTSRNLKVKSTILLGFCVSDHAPVLAKVRTSGHIERPSIYRMNIHQLNDPELFEKMEIMWKEKLEEIQQNVTIAPEVFFKGLYESKQLARTHGKLKANSRRQKEDELHENLAKAQIELKILPDCVDVQTRLLEVEEKLNELMDNGNGSSQVNPGRRDLP